MVSPCGFLEGSRSPGRRPGPGSTSRPDAAREAYEYKPKRTTDHVGLPGRSGGASPALARRRRRYIETVILDDSGYETLPTSPVRRRGRHYTATDRPAAFFLRGSAGATAARPAPGGGGENAC